ncbi:MAG: hypothetical protein IIV87_00680 [Oscillospiraceae bacterium]|nr:hypothetical protein [Oscillospiraceae bacterium]
MKLTQNEVKGAALHFGADLVGVAPVSRFDGLPANGHPCSINPEAKSVIVLGFMITRGALRGVEENTAWHTLGAGDPVQPLILVQSTYNLTRWLEDMGAEATPLYKHPLELRNQGVPVSPDKPAPDVLLNFDYAAMVAGLGTIGKGKFFLSPEYGPRQVFSIVITDAEIEPNEVADIDLCGDCTACMDACPAHAIDLKNMSKMAVMGKEVAWNTLCVESCLICKSGATPNPYLATAEPSRVGAACGRACVNALEKRDVLKLKYVNAFRKEQ